MNKHGHYVAFFGIILTENVHILIEISLNLIYLGKIGNDLALYPVMVCRYSVIWTNADHVS